MDKEQPHRPGVGVDSKGDRDLDPTKNVENLVEALKETLAQFRTSDIKYVDTQLTAAEKLQNLAHTSEIRLREIELGAESRLRDSLRDADTSLAAAETRRIDQLAQTRQEFSNTIRDMLAESVRTTSTLVSTQLVQIQATFDTRVSKLEAGAFTAAGRSSVQDPQTSDALSRMAASISSLASTTTDAMNKTSIAAAEAMSKLTTTISSMKESESGMGGQRKGMADTNARLLAVVMAVAAVASPILTLLIAFSFTRFGTAVH